MIDLHSHSTASDGRLAPEDVVARAAEAGVDTLALTDHDTVDGLPEAAVASARLGLTLVAGVEISVSWKKRTLHVVGLAFDPGAPALTCGLEGLQNKRAKRAAAIAARLEKHGLDNALARARALAGSGQITRPHFARLLVEDGLSKDMNDAFERYLRPGKPGHAPVAWATLNDAISWIADARGIAVLAHPFGYRFSGAWRRRAVADFASAGGDALEVCTGTTDREQEIRAAHDADEQSLLASVGSDFHAPEQFWLALGRLRDLPTGARPVWDDPRFAPVRSG